MSTTIMANAITTGTRRLSTLGAMWGLGTPPDQTTIAELVVNGGYDMGDINQLISFGATNEQLLALPYPAGSDEMAAAVASLMNQLSGAQAAPGKSAATAPSYPASAIPTAYGPLDFTKQSTWDFISGQFVSTQQALNVLARQAPKDPDVIQMVADFNSLVNKWAGYYNTVFGNDPSPMPLVTLGVVPLIAIGGALVVSVVALLGALYLLNQRIVAKAQAVNAQAGLVSAQAQQAASAAAVQQAANLNAQAQALTNQANALPASQQQQITALRQQAAGLQAQANQLLAGSLTAVTPAGVGPLGPINWSAWLQQNIGLLVGALAAIVIIPPLLRRR